MIKLLPIRCCEECWHYIYDDNEIEERWGKGWCNKDDKEIRYPVFAHSFPEWCTLESDNG